MDAFADGFTATKPIRPLKRKQRRCSAQTILGSNMDAGCGVKDAYHGRL